MIYQILKRNTNPVITRETFCVSRQKLSSVSWEYREEDDDYDCATHVDGGTRATGKNLHSSGVRSRDPINYLMEMYIRLLNNINGVFNDLDLTTLEHHYTVSD